MYSYSKPIPYFFTTIDLIERAVKEASRHEPYQARVFVDGIDKQKAQELTNALRVRGIVLRRKVRPLKDENEALIRLADMWAGCMRSALFGHEDTRAMIERAKHEKYLNDLTAHQT